MTQNPPLPEAHPELDACAIAHVDCDAFYAAVEKRDRPDLADKPVLVGGTSGRGVVTTACYIARRFGPRSAMPMAKALALCPDAVVIRPDMGKYKHASAQVRRLMAKLTAQLEPLSLDEAYLDLRPEVRRYPDPPLVQLQWLQQAVWEEVGITCSVGLSANKALAKLASDWQKPAGFTVLGPQEAPARLAPLPVKALHGVGPAMAARLERLGITTIADLQAQPEAALTARFGSWGQTLHQRAFGIDHRPVKAERIVKTVSTETTFHSDLSDFQALSAVLETQAQSLQHRAERAGVGGRTVILKLKTARFVSLTRQTRLGTPTVRAATMADAARPLLAREANGRAFRLLGIGLADLVPVQEADPPDLFSA